MSGWRLAEGGRIDRRRPLRFTWAGKAYGGFAGDTLASALLANGVEIVGRSFKYHRPRGLLAAGLEEPNAIVHLGEGSGTVPNLKATQVELHDGLTARPVNAWPSATFDAFAVNGLFKRFLPAAFYYKTFMWPSWRLFEPAIRRAAGLGVAPVGRDPDTYEHSYGFCDVLVVGSGAAGLAAAEEARAAGLHVILVEHQAELGGGLLDEADEVEGRPPEDWRSNVLARLEGAANVTLMPRTMAFGYYDHNLVGLVERLTDHLPAADRLGPRERLWKVRARRVVLATGAFERTMPFGANDLPGVMLASAARTYLGRYAVAPGRRAVVVTNNDTAYDTAFLLAQAGVDVAAVVDTRAGGPRAEEARERGLRVVTGVALAAEGRRRVRGLAIADIATRLPSETIACDTVLVSGGWNPAVHLHSQSGGTLEYHHGLATFLPGTTPQNAISIGAAAGVYDASAAAAGGRAAARGNAAPAPEPFCVGPVPEYREGDPAAHGAWVDLQNDVTVGDVQLAVRENFRSIEHVKRYTTLGMASDQGKTSNVAAIGVVADLLDRRPEEIGTTRFRPPFDPVTIGAFAGRDVGAGLSPLARTAAHGVHVAAGARMEQYGGWLRAAFYPGSGESEDAAIAREVLATRADVGIFDASPLGKIEVQGPDAAEFLERMYVNQVKGLKPGRLRYALMLNENGVVFDDGVCARLAGDRFLVGTTSGHAATIAEQFEEWLQCEWPHLKVLVEDVTTSWAVVNLAGPRARDVLAAIGTDIDLAADAFPHMTMREGLLGGVPARVQRVSFTGELSYEVSVPWSYGEGLWTAAMRSGEAHGITPFGIESLMAMRIEKGFLHVGSDTDGTTLPQDVGFGGVVAKKPWDFVGRRSTMRPDGLRADRRQLVGLEVLDGGPALDVGAHIVSAGTGGMRGTQGWVTSSVMSPTLGRPLAMGLVERGTSRLGEEVEAWSLGRSRRARICDQRFLDPEGTRLDA